MKHQSLRTIAKNNIQVEGRPKSAAKSHIFHRCDTNLMMNLTYIFRVCVCNVHFWSMCMYVYIYIYVYAYMSVCKYTHVCIAQGK